MVTAFALPRDLEWKYGARATLAIDVEQPQMMSSYGQVALVAAA